MADKVHWKPSGQYQCFKSAEQQVFADGWNGYATDEWHGTGSVVSAFRFQAALWVFYCPLACMFLLRLYGVIGLLDGFNGGVRLVTYVDRF